MIDNQGISTGREVRNTMQQIEDELIDNYKSQFRQGKDKPLDSINLDNWRTKQMRKFRNFKKKNKRIIKTKVKHLNRSILSDLEASYNFGVNHVSKQISKAKKKGFKPEQTNRQVKSFYRNTKTKKLVHEIQQEINKSFNNMLKDLEDRFMETVSKVTTKATAAKTLYAAVDKASRNLLVGGVVGTVTKNGRKMNAINHMELISVEISQDSMFHGGGEKRNEAGIHTVYITVHASTCKLCTPWQGKILIDDVFSDGKPNKKYPLLSKAIKEGFMHPNCRHEPLNFIPGVDRIPDTPNNVPKNSSGTPDKREQDRIYQAEQKQRNCENQIRKWKRIASGSLSEAEQKKARLKVKEWQARRRQLVKANPELYRAHTWRENQNFKMPKDKRWAELKKKKVI